jgi:hypothetical protein
MKGRGVAMCNFEVLKLVFCCHEQFHSAPMVAFANPRKLRNSTLDLAPKNIVHPQAEYHWSFGAQHGSLWSTLNYYSRSSVLRNDFRTPGFDRALTFGYVTYPFGDPRTCHLNLRYAF